MSNTIEKALQRQKEAQKKQREQAEKEALLKEQAQESSSETKTEEKSDATDTQPVPQEQNKIAVNPDEKAPYILDLDSLEEKGHVSIRSRRSQINEEYREIKRKLLANAFGAISSTLHNSNIIMVTSGRPSEGKTFTASNLALSIAAEQDKTVLLVDADVLKPNVLNTLQLEKRPGLMEYLTGDVDDVADVIYPTNIDKLKIIPAGKSHHLSTELLASQKMHETVDEFANRYADRVVIFDTPPLIGINESAILANFAGQAVVVTEEGKSKIADVRHAVERLNPDMAIGFVVNKSVNNDADGTGYYGYYYAERSE